MNTHSLHRLHMFLIGSMLVLCLLTACTAAGQPATRPTVAPTNQPTTLPTATAMVSPSPIYNPDRQSVRATAEALMRVLPTATLNSNSLPGKAEREQFNDLYDRAWSTTLAQNPPPLTVPPNWIPTVTEPLTPWPTDPRIPAGAGWISDAQGPRPFPLVAKVYNFWVERTDDDGIIVYAGSLYDNAAQGTLLIQRLN
jgi:hypothetical protein